MHPTICDALAPFITDLKTHGQGLTPVGHFLADMANGYKPSIEEMQEVADKFQAVVVDMPEFNYLTGASFEAVSDSLQKAQRRYAGDMLFHGIAS